MGSDEHGPRRAPRPEDRRRDPERTRRALLDAALVEFADKGRAGARVSAIADRAGVNKQLISYYFGGKDGLYDALVEHWHRQEDAWSARSPSLAELVTEYLRAAVEQPDLHRLFLRELLDRPATGREGRDRERDAADLADLERRRAAGELADDVDPALALLLFQGAVSASVVFAQDVPAMTGIDPTSPEFLDRYGALLRRVVASLAEPPPPASAPID